MWTGGFYLYKVGTPASGWGFHDSYSVTTVTAAEVTLTARQALKVKTDFSGGKDRSAKAVGGGRGVGR